MNYKIHSFRYGEEIFTTNSDFKDDFNEILEVLNNITDADIISNFNSSNRKAKSLSEALNKLIKERLSLKSWGCESPIFQEEKYRDRKFRLDFAKNNISVEVAFNHGEAIAWNLLKPVLASELNHVDKAIQTKGGIIICATEELKIAGGFDSSVGTYEKFIRYLFPMNNFLTVPMVIIGLKAPNTFKVDHSKENNKYIGEIIRLEDESGDYLA